MNRRMFLEAVAGSALLTSAFQSTSLEAGHRYRTRTRCCLPHRDYKHDLERFGASEIAVADPARSVVWLETASEAVDGATRDVVREKTVQQKPFNIRAAAITVDPISLDQIGLNLYSTGQLVATGRLTHNGAPDVRGNHVSISLWAYTATPADREGLEDPLINTPTVWSCCQKLWASRGRSRVIELTDSDKAVHPKLQQFFQQITHMKVELEYQRDR